MTLPVAGPEALKLSLFPLTQIFVSDNSQKPSSLVAGTFFCLFLFS